MAKKTKIQVNAEAAACPVALGVCHLTSATERTFTRASAPKVPTTMQDQPVVVLVLFGKLQRYGRAEYEALGGKFARMLKEEWYLLDDQLSSLYEIWKETKMGGVVWVGASLAALWQSLFSRGSHSGTIRVPDAPGVEERKIVATTEIRDEDFNDLHNELLGIPHPSDDPSEHELYDIGVRLNKVRHQMARLSANASNERERNIEAAAAGESYARLVADSAFSALHIAARLAAAQNPVTELGYRIAVMFIEGSAYGVGSWAAGTTAVPELLAVLKNRLPSILVDALIGRFMKSAQAGGYSARQRSVAEYIVRQVVEFICDLLVLFISTDWKPKKADFDLLWQQVLARAVAGLIGLMLNIDDKDARVKQLGFLVAKAVVETLQSELVSAKQEADARQIAYMEALCARLPMIIARFFTNLVLGALGQARVSPADASLPPPPKAPPATKLGRTVAKVIERLDRKSLLSTVSFSWTRKPGSTRGRALLTSEEWQASGLAKRYNRAEFESLRAIASEYELILVLRLTNEASLRFVGNPAFWSKALSIKLKTADSGPLNGLVVFMADPSGPDSLPTATHVSASDASNAKAAHDAGYLVRADGLVFHPGMLPAWARQHGVEGASPLQRILEEVHGSGHFMLGNARTEAVVLTKIANLPDDTREATRAAWNKLQAAGPALGVRGDHDVYEVIDARTGMRITLDEAANRDKLNDLYGIHKRTGANAAEVAAAAPFQHSAWSEYRTADLVAKVSGLGKVAIVLPGDRIPVVVGQDAIKPPPNATDAQRAQIERQNRAVDVVTEAKIEEHLKSETAAYKTLADRKATALQEKDFFSAEKGVDGPRRKGLRVVGKTKVKLRSVVLKELPRSPVEPTEVIEIEGTPVSLLELQASVVVRGLTLLHPANADLLAADFPKAALEYFWATQRRLQVAVAIDGQRSSLVIATHANDGAQSALVRIFSLYAETALAKTKPRRYVEIVSPFAFTTYAGIAGILPGANASESALADPLSNLSKELPKKDLQGFRAIDEVETYGGVLGDVRGVRLDAALRERGAMPRLHLVPVEVDGHHVTVFREPIVRISNPAAATAILGTSTELRDLLDTHAGLVEALVMRADLPSDRVEDEAAVTEAVRRFQASRLMFASGKADAKTKKALAVALGESIDDFRYVPAGGD
ncbi:MAG: hypothetical protein U0414_10685 [Polyangiaceae bacterium]